jgi:hypothetical protein
MRLFFVASFVVFTACSVQPNDAERAWIEDLETKAALPPGAGKLACYERHYAPIKLSELTGVSGSDDRLLMQGRYMLGGHTGVSWKKTVSDLPKVFDSGCSVIEVIYDTKAHRIFAPARCSPTVAGAIPETVEPPVVC